MIATLSLLKAFKTTLSIVLDNTKNIQKLLNPQNAGGWRGGGIENPKAHFSGTSCRIDLKPGCKYKFVRCLEIYVKKLVSLDH